MKRAERQLYRVQFVIAKRPPRPHPFLFLLGLSLAVLITIVLVFG